MVVNDDAYIKPSARVPCTAWPAGPHNRIIDKLERSHAIADDMMRELAYALRVHGFERDPALARYEKLVNDE